MSIKPIIGITTECDHLPEDERTRGSLKLNWNYAQAIADAGGVPIIIPPTADPEAVAELIDGWLIPGGNDIDAAKFGEKNHPTVQLQDPARFEIEQKLMARVPKDLPVLGICYGCQFLNVVHGGTLDQHIPDKLGAEYHSGGTLDRYEIDGDSLLAQAAATIQVEGKSYHHQAVGKVGQGLKVVAEHKDGTVEAIESTERPWLIGVQWHPERTLEDSATQRLFQSFVRAAADFRRRKGRTEVSV